MAGDWIKMKVDLLTNPKVVRISSALKADRLRIVGGLYSAWCLFDTHSIDGTLAGYSFETVDELVGLPGLAKAMESVDWLAESTQGIVIPRFDEHNGVSAKRRAQDKNRKQEGRASASEADKNRTREEKRREDKKEKAQAADLFARFWSGYPRKDAKANAAKKFLQINPDNQLFEKIMDGLENHKRSQQWLKDGGQYIPHAATWLNQKRWEDVIDFNGIIHPSGQAETDVIASNENEIRHRRMLCSIALRDYEEAKASGESEAIIGFLKTDYEKALSSLRELCHD